MKNEHYEQYLSLVETVFHARASSIIDNSKNKRVYVEFNSIDSVIGGLTIVESDKGIGSIMYMCVEPNCRSKGIGGKLLQQLHEDFKGLITLRTRNAESFYLKHGYKTIGDNGQHKFMIKYNELF